MNRRQAIETASEADRIGFFGKVPTHGDFVSINLDGRLKNELDLWMQEGLQAVQQERGRAWRDHFRSAPAWRFVVRRGAWSPATVAGVLLPSADRVGRDFPLVIAAQLPGTHADPMLLCYDDTWFTAAEALAETTRTSDFDLNHLTAGLKRMRVPRHRTVEDARERPAGRQQASVWWTIDPESGQALGFGTAAAPTSDDFLRLLKPAADSGGEVPSHQVQEREPPARAPRPSSTPSPVREPLRIGIEKSFATHPGTRSILNADSLLISEGANLFAVADGVAADAAAAQAAKLTINTLTGVSIQQTREALVHEIKGKLGRAHSLLQSVSQTGTREPQQASVVVLAIARDEMIVVWAGDARCYLVRGGMMRCLTQDHVEVGLRRKLARCVGGQRQFVPEVLVDTLQDGDRLLLCSAPLPRSLNERSIAETLLETRVEQAASALVQDALISDARDNLSAVVVGVKLG